MQKIAEGKAMRKVWMVDAVYDGQHGHTSLIYKWVCPNCGKINYSMICPWDRHTTILYNCSECAVEVQVEF